MNGKQRCRVILAYDRYRVGDYVWPTGVLRDQLVRAGFVELAPEEPEPVPMAAPIEVSEPVREQQTLQARRGPGRPRRYSAGLGPDAEV